MAVVHAGLFYAMSHSAWPDRASAPVSMLVDLVPMARAPDERRSPAREAGGRAAPPTSTPPSPRLASALAPASSAAGMLPPPPQEAAYEPRAAPVPAAAGRQEGPDPPFRGAEGGAAGLERAGGSLGAAPDPYPAMIFSWIEARKRYPDRARLAGQEGVATVAITLDRRGRLIRVDLVASSGHAALDDAALAQVSEAQPFPPAPPGARWNRRRFEVPMVYRLRRPSLAS